MRGEGAARPRRLVLLGHPVAHSLSPTFQNAALRAAGIPLTYEAVDVPPDVLGDTLRSLVAEGAAGNVTVPHKVSTYARCDRLTPTAAEVGAVNTFWTDDGLLVGDNTDVGGCERAVARLLGDDFATPLRVAVLGAGGAAAAAVWATRGWGVEGVRLWNRSPARARALAARLAAAGTSVELAASPGACVAEASLVINATTLGMRAEDPPPVEVPLLQPRAAVLDLVYRPDETRWVREARARGHRAADGLTMLVEQGALAFERWFGEPPDRAAMWRSVAGARAVA